MHRALALPILVAALCLPGAARADVLDVYQRIASRDLSPAPLVPTAVPRIFEPIDRAVEISPTRGGRGYSVRVLHYGSAGPDAIIVVSGGEFRSMRALLRDHRRLGFEAPKRTRIRGRRGYLITRRLGPTVRTLAWLERGVVYSVGSGTPRKVSLRQLRFTAKKLDRLGRDWIGGHSDPENFSEAFAVTTERTVTVEVSFQATCAPPGNPDASIVRVGQAGVTLLQRDGDRFSFGIAEHRAESEELPWTGTVMGSISPAAITLDIRATAAHEGDVCDTGALTLTLDRRFR